jgi:hypothetical protein
VGTEIKNSRHQETSLTFYMVKFSAPGLDQAYHLRKPLTEVWSAEKIGE